MKLNNPKRALYIEDELKIDGGKHVLAMVLKGLVHGDAYV